MQHVPERGTRAQSFSQFMQAKRQNSNKSDTAATIRHKNAVKDLPPLPDSSPPLGTRTNFRRVDTTPTLPNIPSGERTSTRTVTMPEYEITNKTTPKELIAIIKSLQSSLNERTDSVNAIQRNFQRLNTMFKQEQEEHLRVKALLESLQNAQNETESHEKVTSVLQQEFQSLLEEHRSLEEQSAAALLEKQQALEAAEASLMEADRAKAQLSTELALAMETLSQKSSALADIEEALADTLRLKAQEHVIHEDRMKTLWNSIVELTGAVHEAVVERLPSGEAASEISSIHDASKKASEERCVSYLQEVLQPQLIDKIKSLAVITPADVERLHVKYRHHQVDVMHASETRERGIIEDKQQTMWQWIRFALSRVSSDTGTISKLRSDLDAKSDFWRGSQNKLDNFVASEAALAAQHLNSMTQQAMDIINSNHAAVQRDSANNASSLQQRLNDLESKATLAEANHKSEVQQLKTQISDCVKKHAAEVKELADIYNQLTMEKAQREEELLLDKSRLEISLNKEQNRVAQELAQAEAQRDAAERSRDSLVQDIKTTRMCMAAFSKLFESEHSARMETVLMQSVERAAAYSSALRSYRQATDSQQDASAKWLLTAMTLEREESETRLDVWRTDALELQANVSQLWAHTHKSTEQRLSSQTNCVKEATEKYRTAMEARIGLLEKDLAKAQGQLKDIGAESNTLRNELWGAKDALKAVEARTLDHQQLVKQSVRRVLSAEEASESTYSCPLCLQLFKKSRTCVPCGHTFCEQCFFKHSRNQKILKAINSAKLMDSDPLVGSTSLIHCVSAANAFYCPECHLQNVTAVVETRPLEELGSKFAYKKQVLQEILSSLANI